MSLEVEEGLLSLPQFYESLSTEDFIVIIIQILQNYAAVEKIVVKCIIVLALLVRIGSAVVELCLRYDLHSIIPNIVSTYVDSHNATDPAEGTLFAVLLSLIGNMLVHNIELFTHLICSTCVTPLMTLIIKYIQSGPYITKILRICGQLSLDDKCVLLMLKQNVVQTVTTVIKAHATNTSLLKYGLDLFANLFSLDVSINYIVVYYSIFNIMMCNCLLTE